MTNLIDILPPTKEDTEIAKEVSKLLNIPVDILLKETIEDIERRTDYKNKLLDTSPLSLSYVARHHVIYPTLTIDALKKMHERIQNF